MKALFVLIFCFYAVLTVANRTPFESYRNEIDVFDTLDDYSLLEILDMLNLSDLVTVASMSPRISQMVWDFNLMSEVNIKNATLRLELSGHKLLTKVYYLPVGEDAQLTELFIGHDLILATLKAFCPIFGRLFIMLDYYHSLNSTLTQEIVDYVNRYCAAIPQQFHIINGKGAITEFIALNVSSVSINYPEKFESFSLEGRFPQLKKLSVRIDTLFGINESLPNLKHFELMDRNCGRFHLRAFGEKNPQIRSVKLDLCEGLDSLQEVNEVFPDLESLRYTPKKVNGHIERVPPKLQTGTPDNDRNVVRFQKVKKYAIDLLDNFIALENFTQILSVQFDQLESLTYFSPLGIYTNGLLDIIKQYQKLIRLDCSHYGLTYEDIWRVVSLLPNLKEITIRPQKDRTHSKDILRFMTATSLDTIHAWISDVSVKNYRELVLPEQWSLHVREYKSIYSRGLTFKRN